MLNPCLSFEMQIFHLW